MADWRTDDENKEAVIQADIANAWDEWLEDTYVDPAELEDK
jgi:hypothetical protein